MEALRLPFRDRVVRIAIRAIRRAQKGSYTAGSAIVCFSTDRREVLLFKMSYMKVWGFPGGFKNRSESAEEAARREMHEEVQGLSDLPLRLADLRIQEHTRHIDVVFFAIVPEDLRPAGLEPTSREIRSAAWVKLDDALTMLNSDGIAILRLALNRLELSQLP